MEHNISLIITSCVFILVVVVFIIEGVNQSGNRDRHRQARLKTRKRGTLHTSGVVNSFRMNTTQTKGLTK